MKNEQKQNELKQMKYEKIIEQRVINEDTQNTTSFLAEGRLQ